MCNLRRQKDSGYGTAALGGHSGGNPNYLSEAAATGFRMEKTENESFQQSILEFV